MRVDWLLRCQDLPAQHTLTRHERLHRLANAFAISPGGVAALAGSRVLLVDDVMTTGASVHACAVALRGAGVREVQVAVLARTELE